MACGLGIRNGLHVLTLEGTLTRADAPQMVALLRAASPSLERLEVDARELRAVDTCVLQVLCSVRKSVRLFATGGSAVLDAALERAGLGLDLIAAEDV